MKNLFVVLVVGILATTASAGDMWMAPLGDPGNIVGMDLAAGGTASMGIYMNLLAGENIESAYIDFANSVGDAGAFTATSVTISTDIAPFVHGIDNSPCDALDLAIGFDDDLTLTGVDGVQDSYLIATVNYLGIASVGTTDLNFGSALTGFIGHDGTSFYDWSTVAASGYVNVMNLLNGSGGWPTAPFTPPWPENPFVITHTPEPASLALLALGGLALIRRR